MPRSLQRQPHSQGLRAFTTSTRDQPKLLTGITVIGCDGCDVETLCKHAARRSCGIGSPPCGSVIPCDSHASLGRFCDARALRGHPSAARTACLRAVAGPAGVGGDLPAPSAATTCLAWRRQWPRMPRASCCDRGGHGRRRRQPEVALGLGRVAGGREAAPDRRGKAGLAAVRRAGGTAASEGRRVLSSTVASNANMLRAFARVGLSPVGSIHLLSWDALKALPGWAAGSEEAPQPLLWRWGWRRRTPPPRRARRPLHAAGERGRGAACAVGAAVAGRKARAYCPGCTSAGRHGSRAALGEGGVFWLDEPMCLVALSRDEAAALATRLLGVRRRRPRTRGGGVPRHRGARPPAILPRGRRRAAGDAGRSAGGAAADAGPVRVVRVAAVV